MNIQTDLIFYPDEVMGEIFPLILSEGSNQLKNSKKLAKYGISLREVFGLCLLTIFRKELEKEKSWIFSTEPKLSDDGIMAVVSDKQRLSYYECLEQVYLPGEFLDRNRFQSMNNYIFQHVKRTKDKGPEYRKNKSLLVLSDIKSKDSFDCFEWQDFVKEFFLNESFLHLYFLSLLNHTDRYNDYYLLSFTNQKHRQNLNGEFRVRIEQAGNISFECLQKINLLKNDK